MNLSNDLSCLFGLLPWSSLPTLFQFKAIPHDLWPKLFTYGLFLMHACVQLITFFSWGSILHVLFSPSGRCVLHVEQRWRHPEQRGDVGETALAFWLCTMKEIEPPNRSIRRNPGPPSRNLVAGRWARWSSLTRKNYRDCTPNPPCQRFTDFLPWCFRKSWIR